MKHYILSILASLGIVVLSLAPMPEVPHLAEVPLYDKWIHFVMYGCVCCVYWFDFFRNGNSRSYWSKWLLWIVVFPIVFGGLMELCQRYLTTCRSGEWLDFVADSVGVVLAIPLGLFVIPGIARRFKPNRSLGQNDVKI